MTDELWLRHAVDLATANVGAGGGPFGSVVVAEGVVLGKGVNRVTRDRDPTAHAEVVAIRAACATRGDFSLTGCVLYTSCEPCPMCLAAALWSRVDRIVYAADRHDAARGGFDDRVFYEMFATDRADWATRVEPLPLPGAAAPFDAWLAAADRIDY
ncbi:nucleoside deaminase [Pseudonocardia sp.]|uniref:nucleoside deaminase n=1 Tax=Pseudonocardia sp. TaxID=60912 RepID=UPI003D0F364E